MNSFYLPSYTYLLNLWWGKYLHSSALSNLNWKSTSNEDQSSNQAPVHNDRWQHLALVHAQFPLNTCLVTSYTKREESFSSSYVKVSCSKMLNLTAHLLSELNWSCATFYLLVKACKLKWMSSVYVFSKGRCSLYCHRMSRLSLWCEGYKR